jgi:hypothetical protein
VTFQQTKQQNYNKARTHEEAENRPRINKVPSPLTIKVVVVNYAGEVMPNEAEAHEDRRVILRGIAFVIVSTVCMMLRSSRYGRKRNSAWSHSQNLLPLWKAFSRDE